MKPLSWLNHARVLAITLGLTGISCTTQLTPDPRPLASKEPDATTTAKIQVTYGKLPLSFEANQGQTDGQVQFVARGSGYNLFLTSTEAVLQLRNADVGVWNEKPLLPTTKSKNLQSAIRNPQSTVLRMHLVGANPTPQVVGLDQLSGKSNYFIGNDPTKWHTDVPLYAKVQYEAVYPGVDLIYYGNQRQLEYDFVVAPGADPATITLTFAGADKLEVDAVGDLVLHVAGGDVRLKKPLVYQEVEGARREVAGGYRLSDGQVGFQVGAYDVARPLVIDPVLTYATYIGSDDFERGYDIAVDGSGQAYVVGQSGFPTDAADFPVTAGAFDPTFNGGNYDLFVAKLNAAGSALVYATYLGGNGNDAGDSSGEHRRVGIAVDSDGNAYVAGATTSTDFPTTGGAFDTTANGSEDAFVTKLNAAGSALVYSTYLGAAASDGARAIAVDSDGNAYVVGGTSSSTFPTTVGAFDSSANGSGDVFVTKLNAAGSALVYSTFIGGSGFDSGYDIALDDLDNAYVIGETDSIGFPTTLGAFDTTFNGGSRDAFVAKLNATGSALVYSTYLGGSGADDAPFGMGFGIAVDSFGNAYATGATDSSDFPVTAGAFDETFNGGFKDAFVTKLDPDASGTDSLVYSTYLGGSVEDRGLSIAVDADDQAHVVGFTNSANFPTANAFDSTLAGGLDAFVTKLNADGSAPVYSTYLGGNNFTDGRAIALDFAGNAYVTGETFSSDLATPGAFDTTRDGGRDAYAAKISEVPTTPTFNVNPSADDTTACDANGCSLRGAILAANNLADATINLPAGTYEFAIGGEDETSFSPSATIGDLDVTKSLTIQGAGAATTIIDGNHLDKVFQIIAGTVTINDVTIRNGTNAAGFNGGGIDVCGGTLHLNRVVIESNQTAARGGGISVCEVGHLFVTDSIIRNNTAGSHGGGIAHHIALSTVTIANSMISGNVSGTVGGGIQSFADLTISDSTISGNFAPESGGGIIHTAGTLTLTNSTISGNGTNGGGGGLDEPGVANLNNVTITDNTADEDADGLEPVFLVPADGGGVLQRAGGTVNFKNTIIGGNSDLGSPAAPDCSGTLNSQGYNLIGNTTGCTIAGDSTGNITNTPPLLGPLADNGGPTQTHAPLSGNLVIIDAGNPGTPGSGGNTCEATDQRGVSRPQGAACDIGAYEAEADECVPSTEVCDGLDNDCDGTVDESLVQSCYTGPDGTEGVGVCQGGTQTCSNGSFGACSGEVTPSAEVCGNTIDEDCDGVAADCSLPSVHIGNVSVIEGDSGATTSAVFDVILSGASSQTVTVDFATDNGIGSDRALAGSDYVAQSGTLTFNPQGATSSQTVTVAVNDDSLVEPDEIFFVFLSSPTNAQLGSTGAFATIINDDTGAPLSETVIAEINPSASASTGSPPSPGDPVETTVAIASNGNGGEVIIDEGPVTETPPPGYGYSFLGHQVNLTAPPQSVGAPLRITFEIHETLLPESGLLEVFKDGVLVPACSSTDGTADPDPCIASSSFVSPGGYWVVEVLTSTASSWNFGRLYEFSGFFQPVDNLPTLNSVKAGSAIPVKFGLGGNQGLSIFWTDYPKSQKVPCDSTAPMDGIEQMVTAGGSSLSYDASTDKYTYVWKTDKAWAGQCRQLVIKLIDGTFHRANFKCTK
jgi:hypothetical protein